MSNNDRTREEKFSQKETGLAQHFLSFRTTQIILLLFSTLEALIALRIMLKLIGAYPENPIVALIYGLTSVFLVPFVGLVSSPSADGMILETSSMVAVVIYALMAVAFEKLTPLLPTPSTLPGGDLQ